MHISYREIFKSAWQIAIKNKALWLFGFFASFISLEAVYEVAINQIQQVQNLQTLRQKILELYPSQVAFINTKIYFLDLITGDFRSYLFFIFCMAAFFMLLWLIFTSQIYIIKNAVSLYKNKKITGSEIFRQSNEKFWPVFGINALSKIFLYIGFLALSLPLLFLFLTQNFSASVFAYIIFLLLFILLAIITGFLTAFATNFIILKNLNILEAIRSAWQLFSRNIIISLEIATLLFLLKIFSLIIVLCISALCLIPLLIVFITALMNQSLLGVIMSFTLIVLTLLIIYFWAAAVYTVFYLSSWAITFVKLTEESLVGKIIYLLQSIPGLFRKKAKEYNIKLDKQEIKQEAIKLAKIAGLGTKIVSKKLTAKYIELEPQLKKQSKKIAKKLNSAYLKLEPKVAKEIKKFISQKQKSLKSKRTKSTPSRHKTTKKRTAKK